MVRYILNRLGHAVIVLVGVSIVVFGMLHLLPGGPARAILGTHATPVTVAAFNEKYGLGNPLPVQYFLWLKQVASGNLGYSYKLDQSVDTLISEYLPRTLVLAGTATILALVIAIPLGIMQAVRRNKLEDSVVTVVNFFLYSMPTFFLGTMLILLFSVTLKLLPSAGPNGSVPVWDQLSNLVLPVASLTLVTIALFSRYMRSSTLDVLLQDYVRTARASGLPFWQVLWKHVLRNASLPIVTLLGLSLPGILSGALVTESLFNYPGMGYLFWQAAQTDDFPVEIGVTMVVALGVVVGSLVADLAVGALDPRVRIAR